MVLHSIGEAYGVPPHQLVEWDLTDLAFDAAVLTIAREWERDQVKDLDKQKEAKEELVQKSNDLRERWLDSLPPAVRETVAGGSGGN